MTPDHKNGLVLTVDYQKRRLAWPGQEVQRRRHLRQAHVVAVSLEGVICARAETGQACRSRTRRDHRRADSTLGRGILVIPVTSVVANRQRRLGAVGGMRRHCQALGHGVRRGKSEWQRQ